jgi:phosphoglycerate-specific signal transduction histidine kinase
MTKQMSATGAGHADPTPSSRSLFLGARLGIKVKLQAAFAVVTAMTAIAAAVAITSFSGIERGFQRVATQEVPLMNDALRLSVAASDISAAAARLASAKSADDQRAIVGILPPTDALLPRR